MTGRNVKSAMIVLGAVVVFIGVLLVWGGLTALSQDRDADGYMLSDPVSIDRSSRAVITNDVGLLRGHYDCAGEESIFLNFHTPDDVRVQGVASSSRALFVAIAPADAVARYLDGVAHHEITEWDCDVDDIVDVEYTRHEGSAAPGIPGSELFWVMSTSGAGQQTLDWTIESGEWAVVVMNADASSGISADLRFGALAPSGLDTLAWSSFGFGLVALIGGGRVMYLRLRRPGGPRPLAPDRRHDGSAEASETLVESTSTRS